MRFISSLAMFLAVPAFACIVPLPSTYREHGELLSEANSIVLVQALRPQSRNAQCELVVLQHWIAPPPKPLPVICRLPRRGDWMTDFDAHASTEFWTRRRGRLGIHGDCSVISPAFAIGEKYVLLLGVTPDMKQFEQVSNPNDQWLRYIEQYFEKGKK